MPDSDAKANVGAGQGLIELIEQLVAELRPGVRVQVTPGCSLEADLGLDSLARMELLHRIEDAFNVRLPESAMIEAETPDDLIRALDVAGVRSETMVLTTPSTTVAQPALLQRLPTDALTLVDVLDWHVAQHAERPHICFYSGNDETETITYAQLKTRALAVASGLVERGLAPGQTIAIMLPTCLEFFYSFYGTLIAGGVPVPIYPPARLSQIEDHMRRQSAILDSAQATLLITVPEAKLVARYLRAKVPSLREIVTAAELERTTPPPLIGLRAGDTAFLQYTSGSTGNPKGVVLTHANLLANIRAWGQAVEISADDVCVSWLPLYHDMGLIGAWLGNLYHGGLLVLMSPLDFLARPERWLQRIHRHRATITAAPNFAFELCLRRIKDADLAGVDLSSWRLCANGAEPVSPDTITRFAERFAAYGFPPGAMAPVYGLAECTVGVAVPPLNRKPIIDRVARDIYIRTGRAEPAGPEEPHPLRFIACGRPLPGHEIRVVDAHGAVLGERMAGQLQFRGPSSTSGYFRNPQETAKLFDGEWLNTGDVAYIAEGDLYLTSRVKDMIIRGGHNLYPYELEEAVGNLPGVRKGCVAVVGVADTASGTERLVVVAESRERDAAAREELIRKINAAAVEIIGGPADDVVLAPAYAVLKTSSGKIRRAATRDNYVTGAIHTPQRGAAMQFVRLTLSSLYAQVSGAARGTLRLAYAAYACLWFGLLAPPAWLGSLLLPKAWYWSYCRFMARLFLRLTGLSPQLSGSSGLPPGANYVVVANHSSYLDGLLLVAVLPDAVSFSAKHEFERHFISRQFFNQLGAVFVERFDRREALDHSRQLTQQAGAGVRLAVFPEGTFTAVSGLKSFRMGAFMTCAETGLPLVPVVIRGARAVLRDGSWMPHHGRIAIHLCAAIPPNGAANDSAWQRAIALRDAARAEILRYCGEPDAM